MYVHMYYMYMLLHNFYFRSTAGTQKNESRVPRTMLMNVRYVVDRLNLSSFTLELVKWKWLRRWMEVDGADLSASTMRQQFGR